ncbi:MAG TPA: hypothetical protein DEO87_05955 [Lachnospiraceae bacterium]|nr:hypothetical protein [Lachnospiraceae bacterium]
MNLFEILSNMNHPSEKKGRLETEDIKDTSIRIRYKDNKSREFNPGCSLHKNIYAKCEMEEI